MSLINKLIFLFKRFSWFKRLNAKITYEVLAKYISADSWQFMNYGYKPTAAEVAHLPACSDIVNQQLSANMYHYLAAKIEMKDKSVLEVGSGRGGGARYIVEYFKPLKYIGLDIAQNAVDLANRLHALPGLKFIQGSGENIPLNDGAVDVVVNVESSHGYGDVEKFLREVYRVLKPGGHLLLVDFRNSVDNMALFKQQLMGSGLHCICEENISAKVVEAIEADNDVKCKQIEAWIPKRFQKIFSEFAGVVGSKFYNTLKNGERPYYRFVLVKPAA
jgi:ubiquinone/menaquinone biosynthesis C-methylase UbiE